MRIPAGFPAGIDKTQKPPPFHKIKGGVFFMDYMLSRRGKLPEFISP